MVMTAVRRMSALDAPNRNSISPGSTIRVSSGPMNDVTVGFEVVNRLTS